jgi:hypothetical protein
MGHQKKTAPMINKLCSKCIRTCRQDESVLLVDCARFLPRPFKSEELKFSQLDLFGDSPSEDKS